MSVNEPQGRRRQARLLGKLALVASLAAILGIVLVIASPWATSRRSESEVEERLRSEGGTSVVLTVTLQDGQLMTQGIVDGAEERIRRAIDATGATTAMSTSRWDDTGSQLELTVQAVGVQDPGLGEDLVAALTSGTYLGEIALKEVQVRAAAE